MKTLLIYFILVPSPPATMTSFISPGWPTHWEFLAVEHVTTREYCEYLADSVAHVYRGTPGNVRIVCTDDEGGEA